MWTLRRYNDMSSNLWKDNVLVGSDSGLMVQSFNRKDIVIYVKLRNYDLGDQSRSALEHLFTKYWRNSNAVQQILPRTQGFLWQHTQNCLVFRYGCEKKYYVGFSIGWKSTLKFTRIYGFPRVFKQRWI